MKNRGAPFSCSIFLLQVRRFPPARPQVGNSVRIYISSHTLSRTSGTNVAAKAVTALIAFKHTFI